MPFCVARATAAHALYACATAAHALYARATAAHALLSPPAALAALAVLAGLGQSVSGLKLMALAGPCFGLEGVADR